MITISPKAKFIATILHLAIISIIISINISERNTLLEMGNALATKAQDEFMNTSDIHIQLLKGNEAQLAMVIITAIIVQFVIISIKQIEPRTGTD